MKPRTNPHKTQNNQKEQDKEENLLKTRDGALGLSPKQGLSPKHFKTRAPQNATKQGTREFVTAFPKILELAQPFPRTILKNKKGCSKPFLGNPIILTVWKSTRP
eukprot:2416905-Amphidinium_carterae.1